MEFLKEKGVGRVKRLSTGEPSTLGAYRHLAFMMSGFNETSKVVQLFDEKIARSPYGPHQEVVEEELIMVELIIYLIRQEKKDAGVDA
jgi:hypothetical protein